jgi:hypothetical protein
MPTIFNFFVTVHTPVILGLSQNPKRGNLDSGTSPESNTTTVWARKGIEADRARWAKKGG